MAKRYKVRFRDHASYQSARAIIDDARGVREGIGPRGLGSREFGRSLIRVRSEKRNFISVEPSAQLSEDAGARQLDRQLDRLASEFGAEVVEDFRYDMETDIFEPSMFGPDDPNDPSLEDVLRLIDAPGTWAESTGRGVTIAVVDTGIDGTRPEFPQSKRAGEWQPQGDMPWTDWKGHGTMCACIAAGTRASGGRFDGVAPEANLIACKTRFYDSELTDIYDYLTARVLDDGLNIVATNSFGIQTGTPPPVPADSDFIPALNDALNAGIKVFFSAGNYHEDAGGKPDRCEPTSIWLHKCRADVMSVATCDLSLNMWYYSSRGPGQHFGQAGCNSKPDVTAPTPAHGRVVYGGNIRSLPNGWGTSGACPQAAGLAALLLAKEPTLTRDRLFDLIRNTATSLPYSEACCGTGLINCRRAIDSI